MKVAVHILHRFLVIASCHYALETVAFDGFVNIAGGVNADIRIGMAVFALFFVFTFFGFAFLIAIPNINKQLMV